MYRLYKAALILSLPLWTGCGFGLVKMNPSDSSEPGGVETGVGVDSGTPTTTDGSELVGSWRQQNGTDNWTWTAGPSGSCAFDFTQGGSPVTRDCTYSADGTNLTIEDSSCPGVGAYTYQLVGTETLLINLVEEHPMCTERSTALTSGPWNRLW